MSTHEIFQRMDYTEIKSYLENGKEEHLSLEFKTINDSGLKHKDDKKNLAKALSGFANSAGGLIVWDIVAKKNENGIDCAYEIHEIDSPKLFLSRLNELTGEAVTPIIDDVEHKIIKTQTDKGIVVSYIPGSNSGPHMARIGEDRYYKRSGDSFYRMEHFDIEDMFGRRPKAILESFAKVESRGSRTQVVIGIKNIGKGTAKAPFISFTVSEPFRRANYGLDGNKNNGLPILPFTESGLTYTHGSDSSNVIHPGVSHEVALIWAESSRLELPYKLIVECALAAEGFPLTRCENVVEFK